MIFKHNINSVRTYVRIREYNLSKCVVLNEIYTLHTYYKFVCKISNDRHLFDSKQ